jgi:hypothetical protein
MEVDLVAHCGESTGGQFLNTLTCTNLCTGWTEPFALLRRSQEAACDTIDISPSIYSALTQIMTANSSTTCFIVIVWSMESPSRVPVPARKMRLFRFLNELHFRSQRVVYDVAAGVTVGIVMMEANSFCHRKMNS